MREAYSMDFSNFKKNSKGLDWRDSEGSIIKFEGKGKSGEITILENINYKTIKVKYLEKEMLINKGNFSAGFIGNLIGAITFEYKFKVGDIVESIDSEFEILEQFKKENKHHACRAYIVKCLKCGGIHEKIENDIGRFGCGVCSGKIVIPEINSAWKNSPHLIQYIEEDILKTITPNSSRKK